MGSVRMIALSTVIAVGIGQAGIASAHTLDVKVIRGGGQAASIIETQELGVQVFRGSPAVKLAAARGNVSAVAPAKQVVSSGSKVWLIDRAAGTLSVCRLAHTTQLGKRRIACNSRPLPR